jgi:hypothetical protein
MPKDIVQLILATNINSSTFDGSYQAINPSGLPYACYEVRIINGSSENVIVSTDGTNAYEYVLAGDTRYLVAQQAASPGNWNVKWPVGTVFYVNGSSGTGYVYLAGSYNPN